LEIADLIQELIKRFGMRPEQINNGWCWGFAEMVAESNKNAKVIKSDDYKDMFAGHYFIFLDGRYYDAENPEGVNEPQDLIYNQRMKAVISGDKEALKILRNLAEKDPRK